jgi:hypothetical protein
MEELEKQQQDAADLVVNGWRQMRDMQTAIAEARIAMKAESGERAWRQKAEAVRKVIHRIECTFTPTGLHGTRGKRSSKLATVTIYPLVGESLRLEAKNVVPCASGFPPLDKQDPRRRPSS